MDNYSIKNIINFRKIDWDHSEDFFYLSDIPNQFEPFTIKPDYFSYGILTDGSMQVEVDNYPFNINKESFLFYRPNQTLKILGIAPHTKGAFILFTKKFIDYIDENIFSTFNQSFLNHPFNTHIVLSAFDHHNLSRFFSKIFDLLTNIYKERWEYSAKNLLSTLLNETDLILRKYLPGMDPQVNHRDAALIDNFKNLVAAHAATDRSIDFYAEKLYISTSYLHKMVKKQLNQTPAHVINSVLTNTAKSMLLHSGYNIGEIAEKLSFCDIYSFSKYFKKQTGLSPSAYRNDAFVTDYAEIDKFSPILDK